MYDYIKGALAFKNADTAVIENNGIGYKFLINSRTYSLLGEIARSSFCLKPARYIISSL